MCVCMFRVKIIFIILLSNLLSSLFEFLLLSKLNVSQWQKNTFNPKELTFIALSYKVGQCWLTALITMAIR